MIRKVTLIIDDEKIGQYCFDVDEPRILTDVRDKWEKQLLDFDTRHCNENRTAEILPIG